jgi:hypothetical protein
MKARASWPAAAARFAMHGKAQSEAAPEKRCSTRSSASSLETRIAGVSKVAARMAGESHLAERSRNLADLFAARFHSVRLCFLQTTHMRLSWAEWG